MLLDDEEKLAFLDLGDSEELSEGDFEDGSLEEGSLEDGSLEEGSSDVGSGDADIEELSEGDLEEGSSDEDGDVEMEQQQQQQSALRPANIVIIFSFFLRSSPRKPQKSDQCHLMPLMVFSTISLKFISKNLSRLPKLEPRGYASSLPQHRPNPCLDARTCGLLVVPSTPSSLDLHFQQGMNFFFR